MMTAWGILQERGEAWTPKMIDRPSSYWPRLFSRIWSSYSCPDSRVFSLKSINTQSLIELVSINWRAFLKFLTKLESTNRRCLWTDGTIMHLNPLPWDTKTKTLPSLPTATDFSLKCSMPCSSIIVTRWTDTTSKQTPLRRSSSSWNVMPTVNWKQLCKSGRKIKVITTWDLRNSKSWSRISCKLRWRTIWTPGNLRPNTWNTSAG